MNEIGTERLLDILHGAGDCRHCGEPIRSSLMQERVGVNPATTAAGWRTVTLYHHKRTGHGRCEGRETLAEPQEGK